MCKNRFGWTFVNAKYLTSVGPAYIIGDGKIAKTVDSGSKIFSFRTALCCSILVFKGTSSSFVQPPVKGQIEMRLSVYHLYLHTNTFSIKQLLR